MGAENPLEEKHYGFFRGMVIQNNDPERRGRVKVFISELAAQVSRNKGENQTSPKEVYEARFAGGSNINSYMDADTRELAKKSLFWAEQASPLIGSGTAGVCDVKNNVATVGEGYRGAPFEPLGDESITPTGESVSPKAAISQNANPGLFDTGYKTGLADTYNQSLAPTGYNNAVKAMLSIPKVGAQVWVFFENGNILNPVYFGYVLDKNDWNSVFNPQESNPDPHYPGGSENIPNDGQPFFSTGKTVMNTKAGSLEFIETDDLEKIKLSHNTGSFYEMSNNITAEVCTGKKTTVVNDEDRYSVKGNRAFSINGDCHDTYRGNHYITYGDGDNKLFYEDWMKAAEPAFQQSTLFSNKVITAKDPTVGGSVKGNANANYSLPNKSTVANRLTLQTDWTGLINGAAGVPSSYTKKIQHTELGVS
jgi:hypothetical protein